MLMGDARTQLQLFAPRMRVDGAEGDEETLPGMKCHQSNLRRRLHFCEAAHTNGFLVSAAD